MVTLLENNFIIINNNTHTAQGSIYLKEKYTEAVLVLYRKVDKTKETIRFDCERAFILREGYNLDWLKQFIDGKKEAGYEINVLYIHRAFLDDIKGRENCEIINELLDTYKEIKIGVHSGGSLKSIEDCFGERVKPKFLDWIDDIFLSSKKWCLDKNFHKVDEERG